MVRASPDVESVPPEPMPTAAPAAAAPVRAGGAAWTRIVTLVLAWGFLFSLVYLSLAKIRGIPGMRRVGVDIWLSLATLLVLLGAMLWWTWRSVSPHHLERRRRKGDSQWAIAGRHFKKNRLAMAGLAVMILLYVITLVTPLIAPFDPAAQGDIITSRYLPPSAEHLMGTDKFGRDIFSRVLYGARISLSIGFVAVGISITLGTLIGALAGYFGGWVDSVLMTLPLGEGASTPPRGLLARRQLFGIGIHSVAHAKGYALYDAHHDGRKPVIIGRALADYATHGRHVVPLRRAPERIRQQLLDEGLNELLGLRQ